MRRDSGEANRFQLVGNLQLRNSAGGSLLPPRQDSWLGQERWSIVIGQKGLMGLAAMRTYSTCCVHVPHLSARLSPNPRLTFLCLRPVL